MTFRPTLPSPRFLRGAFAVACVLGVMGPVQAGQQTAVVPHRTIYPGEELNADLVREVKVTNPNLRGGYVAITSEILGKVTTRTLLPGHTIPAAALRDAWTVQRGSTVPLVFDDNGMIITAVGTPLQNAFIGDFIQARNIETGVVISGTVMADGSVRVAPK